MWKLGFYQLTVFKGDGGKSAVVDVAVAQVTRGEAGLIDFTHGKIEVSGIAVLHCQMVQYCFRQIGSHQFAGYEFTLNRELSANEMLERSQCSKRTSVKWQDFSLSGAELDMTEVQLVMLL